MREALSNPARDWSQLHETLSSAAVDDKRISQKSRQLLATLGTFSSLTFNGQLYISLVSIFSATQAQILCFSSNAAAKNTKQRHCPCSLDMILEFLFLHYELHHDDDSNFVIGSAELVSLHHRTRCEWAGLEEKQSTWRLRFFSGFFVRRQREHATLHAAVDSNERHRIH